MPKIQNLSPKFKIPNAEKELELMINQQVMGNRQGGLSLYSTKFKRGYGNAVFGSDENGIWLGNAEFAGAPFRVDMDGNFTSTTATITGAGQNFVSTVGWTATDIDTATWTAGTIKTSDGTSYSIAGGNTGNITVKTYVYLDPATSTTVLQTSTTATDAAGDGIILIAVVQKGATGAKCIIDVVGSAGTTIDGDRIVTGKIQSADGNTFFDLDGDQIQIQDGSSTTIIDSTGLVSSANFTSSSAVSTSLDQKITAASPAVWTDLTGLTSLSFNPSRTVNILLMVQATVFFDSNDGTSDFTYDGRIGLEIGGSIATFQAIRRGVRRSSGVDTSDIHGDTLHLHVFSTITAGSKTFKMQANCLKVSGADGFMQVGSGSYGYIVLGT